MDLWILLVVFTAYLIEESACQLNCLVCSSVNGSNPACENGVADYNSKELIQRNCRSTIGSVHPNTPLQATACISLLGEYKDKNSNQVSYVVSRKCTAASSAWMQARNVNCGLLDSDDHLPGERKFITGCVEACFENECNGKPLMKLSERLRPNMKEFIEDSQRADPGKRIRFPAVFALEENKRTMDGRIAHNINEAHKVLPLVGSFVLACFLLFW